MAIIPSLPNLSLYDWSSNGEPTRAPVRYSGRSAVIGRVFVLLSDGDHNLKLVLSAAITFRPPGMPPNAKVAGVSTATVDFSGPSVATIKPESRSDPWWERFAPCVLAIENTGSGGKRICKAIKVRSPFLTQFRKPLVKVWKRVRLEEHGNMVLKALRALKTVRRLDSIALTRPRWLPRRPFALPPQRSQTGGFCL